MYLHHNREVMLEDVAPPRGLLGAPTTSMPPDAPHILAVCSSLAGVGPYTLAAGCTHRRLAQNGGVGSSTPALGLRCQGSLYMLVFGAKRRCWVVHTGVELERGSWVTHVGVGSYWTRDDRDNPGGCLCSLSCLLAVNVANRQVVGTHSVGWHVEAISHSSHPGWCSLNWVT
jgi:hypothetical protein